MDHSLLEGREQRFTVSVLWETAFSMVVGVGESLLKQGKLRLALTHQPWNTEMPCVRWPAPFQIPASSSSMTQRKWKLSCDKAGMKRSHRHCFFSINGYPAHYRCSDLSGIALLKEWLNGGEFLLPWERSLFNLYCFHLILSWETWRKHSCLLIPL